MENNTITNKTKIKKLQKKKALIKAGAKVFSEYGFLNSSIKNITDEAKVAVGTFYSYFNNKEELLGEIYDDILEESINSSKRTVSKLKNNDNVADHFTTALTSALLTYTKDKETSKIVLFKGAGINELLEKKRLQLINKTNEYLENVLNHLKESHSVMIDDIKITSIMITQCTLGVITYWINDKISSNLEDMIFTVCTYQLKALNIPYEENRVKECIIDVIQND